MSDETRATPASALWGEEAAQWWTLLHGEEATVADRQEFLAWVSRSPERIEAYLVIERLMTVLRADTVRWPDIPAEMLIRAAKFAREPAPLNSDSGIERLPIGSRAPDAPAVVPARHCRRFGLGWAAALGVVAAALAAALAGWLWQPGGVQFYQTRAGEQRSILLAEGSRVTLNSASTVEVELDRGRGRRIVHLLRGEALFRVSHDPARPFDVYADDAVVRAIGTEFNVDLMANYAAVTVLQGRVAVMSASQASLPTTPQRVAPGGGARQRLERFPAPPGALILQAAQRVYITPMGLSGPRPVSDLAAATAWTKRQLVFAHRPLGEVVQEINRDGSEHIRIDSAALSAREVTGVIELDDQGSLLDFLADVPGVLIHRTADGTSVVTLRRKPPARAARMSEAQR
ncbi:MAG: FecR family protein [Steroidobacteraceae bacterium]